MLSYWKLHKFPILMVLFSIICYSAFAYDLVRTDFIKLLSLFCALFFMSYKLIQFEKFNFKFLLIAGVLFRLLFLIATPNLSQDFYRFIWDGELVSHGANPYLYTPNMLMEQSNVFIANADILFEKMGSLSAKHFSNYPPLNQIIFAIAALFAGKSILGAVISMRIIIILADIGVLYFGKKILQKLNLPTYSIFWYFLNPLIIIELTGNLHFEGVMLFFFVWSMYLLHQKKWAWAAVVYALSISIKLVPILFLPLFVRYFGFKKSIPFYLIVGGTSLALLAPFFSSSFISNYSDTIGLWFSNFEFNAGIYNLIKQITAAFDVKSYKLIKVFGKISPVIVIIATLLITFLRKNNTTKALLTSMLWILSIYYLQATTVHPWYIVFLSLLAVFTPYRFAIVWSFTVVLSYWAYSNSEYTENLWLLLFEYILVFGFIFYEIFKIRGVKLSYLKK